MSGEGSVFRRASDGAWLAQVSVGPRGHRKVRSRSARTRVEAARKLDELKALVTSNVTPTTLTVGAYLEQWVRDARNIRPTTRHGYEVVVNAHLVPLIGDVPLRELAPIHVERVITTLEPTMSAKTLRNAHSVLRRALGQAVRMDLLTRNVASGQYIETPKVPEQDPRALTVAETDRLLAACRGDRLEALFVVAVDSGLRQGELLGLAWQDTEDGYLTVRQELVYRDGVYKPGPPKTERSKRRVPLSPRAEAALAAHRLRVKADGFVPTKTGPVFTNTSGKALSGSWVTHHFYALLERAEVDRLPFKNLRTTFATRLFELGVPDRIIADLMGHSKTKTTQRHYISTTAEQAIAAIGRLESVTSQSRVAVEQS